MLRRTRRRFGGAAGRYPSRPSRRRARPLAVMGLSMSRETADRELGLSLYRPLRSWYGRTVLNFGDFANFTPSISLQPRGRASSFALSPLRYHASVLIISRIFRAIERRHMQRVSIEIRASDPKLVLLRTESTSTALGSRRIAANGPRP
jgi:hypothetical protein